MKGDPEERAVQIGRYLVQSGATVRAAAQVFGVSKSTVWKDQCLSLIHISWQSTPLTPKHWPGWMLPRSTASTWPRCV